MIELTQHRRDCKCEECYECPKCEELQELLEYVKDEMEWWIKDTKDISDTGRFTLATVDYFDIKDLIRRLKGAV